MDAILSVGTLISVAPGAAQLLVVRYDVSRRLLGVRARRARSSRQRNPADTDPVTQIIPTESAAPSL
jgi:hypothetical protein